MATIKSVLLLGYGMQGKAVLQDLAKCDDVSRIEVIDTHPDFQRHLAGYPQEKVNGRLLDVSDEESLSRRMRDVDVVVEALPAVFSLPVGRLAVECGVSLVSSMYYLNPGETDAGRIQLARDQIGQIDGMAKAKRLSILTEFGLDPGLDLILGAKAISELDKVEEVHMYGAGIPHPNARGNPLQYRFSWSIAGVMRAYRRPARLISGGQVVNLGADRIFEQENCHILEIEQAGAPLECFPNGDAVRYAELFGVRESIREMGRYTCRLPGHCAFWNTMVKCGFLDDRPLSIGGSSISPFQFTTELLGSQQQFQYGNDDLDMTLIRVDARGTRAGKRLQIIYQLVDTRDPATGLTAMQRDVGFTLSRGAQLILQGKLARTGVLTPLDVPYESVFPYLEKYNIRVSRMEFPYNS